ncbi:MAG TPA: S46 family peptidase, partial [Flavobacteriales bacterium]|nr:S46 family peptidase [Flavobacteriales bacterium]
NEIYGTSVFASQEKVNAGLQNPKSFVAKIKNDKGYKFIVAFLESYRKKLEPVVKVHSATNEQLMNQYVAAIYEVFPEKKIWHDANSTLRVGYGLVEGSEPKDGLNYNYYTTSEGILEKYQSGAGEYALPPRLLELLSKKDFGKWADSDGLLHTCFTASAQTTGGNSGSPVLNGYGELIGLNFDRSWESTMSDIMYSPKLCRNIVCDIRYVLFIIDKYAGATHLVDELKLVNASTKEKARIDGIKKEIEDITEQLRINPDNPAMLVNRGQKYFDLNLMDDAQKNVNSAITAKKDFGPALVLQAKIYQKQGRSKEALMAAEKAATMSPADMETKKLVAHLAFQNMNMKRCIEVCGQILKVEKDPDILLLNARANYMGGSLMEACKLYKEAHELGSKEVLKELETCN